MKQNENEVVVKFLSPERKITMYFEQKDGDLNLQMAIDPELNKDEEPDLCTQLASVLLGALNTDANKDDGPKVYTGTES